MKKFVPAVSKVMSNILPHQIALSVCVYSVQFFVKVVEEEYVYLNIFDCQSRVD